MKNPQMPRFVPDHFKTKKMCKYKKMCNRAVDNCAHVVEFVPDCHKTQKICNKAVDAYPPAIQFVPD